MTPPIPLKNPAEIPARLALSSSDRVLLVDAPEELAEILRTARPDAPGLEAIAANGLRGIKETFDAVLVWRENRSGAQALLDAARRRVAEGGALWIVTAMRKVTGPATPASHRIERRDLEKILAPYRLAFDREARVSAWHQAYRFRKADS